MVRNCTFLNKAVKSFRPQTKTVRFPNSGAALHKSVVREPAQWMPQLGNIKKIRLVIFSRLTDIDPQLLLEHKVLQNNSRTAFESNRAER